MGFLSEFIQKKLSDPKPNIIQKIYLIRKVYFTNRFRTYHSNYGEDIILNGWLLKDIHYGFYVDVGCYHPRKFNNTYKLYKKGWRGINIDLDSLKIQAFNMLRPEDCNVFAAISDAENLVEIYDFGSFSVHSSIEEQHPHYKDLKFKSVRKIKTQTLNHVIENSRYCGRRIDVLSVDVEGHDLNVLKSLSFDKYRPKVILVETHLLNLDLIMKSDLYLFLKTKGYHLINWLGLTLVFTYPNNDLVRLNIPFNGEKGNIDKWISGSGG